MIIVRTPFRVSFAGGGSDLANYYEKYGGAVLSTAINKYNYLCMHPYFFKDGYFLKYSQTELVDDVNDIKHNIIRFTTSGALTSTPAPTFLPAPACLRHQPLPPGLFTCATPTTKPT